MLGARETQTVRACRYRFQRARPEAADDLADRFRGGSEVRCHFHAGAFDQRLDLPRFRGELWAWDHGIWSEGILLSCLVGILLFGPRRSHSSIPAGTRVRPSRAAAVKDGPTWGRPKGLSLTAVSTAADWCASGLAV